MFKYIGKRRYVAIDDKIIDKNILEEICRLMPMPAMKDFNKTESKEDKVKMFIVSDDEAEVGNE